MRQLPGHDQSDHRASAPGEVKARIDGRPVDAVIVTHHKYWRTDPSRAYAAQGDLTNAAAAARRFAAAMAGFGKVMADVEWHQGPPRE